MIDAPGNDGIGVQAVEQTTPAGTSQHDPALATARDLLATAVACGEVPGAVTLVRARGQTLWHEAFGFAARQPEQRPMLPNTVFDLASLTKPLATATLVLALADRGLLALDDPIGHYLPEFVDSHRTGLTVRRLLTHTSGLPGWRATYTWGRSRDDVVDGIAQLDVAYPPGTQVQYSCLGFITLGALVERITGQGLDAVARAIIFEPLGLTDIGYRGDWLPRDRCAVTEHGNAFERAMLQRAALTFDGWRTDFYPGQVNDGNAYYGLGGVSGNAGLFASAEVVALLGEMWLNHGRYGETRILSEPAAHLAITDQTPGLNASRGLGWQLNRPTAPTAEELAIPPSNTSLFPPEWFAEPWSARSCGEYLSAGAFGHTGFTGTSLWMDPEADLVVVLLTNAIHPSVEGSATLSSLRARFHNAVAAGVGRSTPEIKRGSF